MEKAMITKMKQAQGPPFTIKIEGMIKDHQMVADGVREFGDHLTATGGLSVKCVPAVQVLTQGFWPSQPPINVDLHGTFGEVMTAFEKFYETKQGGKKRLQWVPVLGDAEVFGVFPKGKYT